MKRLRRIIFNSIAAASALLFAAVAAMGVLSCFTTERFAFARFSDDGDRTFWIWDEIEFGRGGIGFQRGVQSGDKKTYHAETVSMLKRDGFRGDEQFFHLTAPPEYPNFKVGVGDTPVWGGFKYGRFAHFRNGPRRPSDSAVQVVVPLWAVLPALVVPPAIWVLRGRRTRFLPGRCQACGYDLRATPECCPECGMIPQISDKPIAARRGTGRMIRRCAADG